MFQTCVVYEYLASYVRYTNTYKHRLISLVGFFQETLTSLLQALKNTKINSSKVLSYSSKLEAQSYDQSQVHVPKIVIWHVLSYGWTEVQVLSVVADVAEKAF